MSDLVQKLVGALEHCEGVFMSHSIDHINGGKIEDDALATIRAAVSEAKAGGWVAVPVEAVRLAGVALSERPDHPPLTDWEDAAMKVCAMLAARPLPAPPAQKEPT